MDLALPPLPYEKDALDPWISARTLDFHHGKHHRGYLTKLRKIVEGKPEAEQSFEELIRKADGALFNNAAQAWNHAFYWKSLRPRGGGAPVGEIAKRIESSFGGVDRLQRQLAEVATGQFGSGWAWLVVDGSGRLRATSTRDADNPLRHGTTPLLAIDVWEHAYYLDYQNERNRYVEGVIDHLLDWDFALQNLQAAVSAR
jgi:Fe-Mn family superoxide dismutase